MTEDNPRDPDPQSEERSDASAAKDIQGSKTQPDTAAEAQTPEAENSAINASHASANPPDTRPDHRPDHRMEQQGEAAAQMTAVEDFDLNLLLDIPLEITVELGRARVQIQELLNLGAGSTVTLSKLEGEPVDILANDQLIARGEVVLQNKKYGIRITEITSRMDRIKSLN